MNLIFRKANNDEFSTILNLYQTTAQWFLSQNINQWQQWLEPSEDLFDWLKEGIKKEEFWFSENENHEIAGMFRLLYEDEDYWGKQELEAGYVHSLITLRQFTGKNVGEKMLQFVENELIRKNIFLFRLDCVGSNERLCNYYISKGFTPVFEKQMKYTVNRFFEKKL
jgi:ribosomal protein S18 acetylase RimI-like enzyme